MKCQTWPSGSQMRVRSQGSIIHTAETLGINRRKLFYSLVGIQELGPYSNKTGLT